MRIRVFLLLLLIATPVHAVREHIGQTPSGAVYRFAVPEGWRPGDGLVVYQHDLSFEPDLHPDLGPLLDIQLGQGYAVAASGYSQSGWAVLASGQDNRELVERFHVQVGKPGRILAYGASMGGHIALQMAEDATLNVAGALALCPSTAADRHWQAALDLRVSYDAICAGVEGGELPQAPDHPWLVPADRVTPEGLQDLVVRINRCTGVNSPAWLRSQAQQARLDELKATNRIDSDNLLLLSLGYATLGLSDLVRDPRKLAGGIAVGNEGVAYGDVLDSRVRRVDVDPFAALDLRLRANLRGEGDARILNLHTQRDPIIAPGHQRWLRDRVAAGRFASAIVAEAEPSHCGFAAAEIQAGWEALHDWISADESTAVPDAVELQARCLALTDQASATGPCRIDAQANVEPLSETIRPRAPAVAELDGRYSGGWVDPTHPGESWLVEVLDEDTALVYGVMAPNNAAIPTRWLLGTGRISEDGIAIDSMYTMQGGNFGAAFAGSDAQVVPWGQVRIVFTGCGSAQLRFQGASRKYGGERTLSQVRHLGGGSCSSGDVDDAREPGPSGLSGSWYDMASPGQGMVVTVDEGSALVTLFSYSPTTGEPLWLQGEGAIGPDGHVTLDMSQVLDTDSSRALRPAWGEVEVEFVDCDLATLRYRSDEPTFGAGVITLGRLTRPSGLPDCGLVDR